MSADSDEDRGRALVAGRSRGLCEGCGEPRPLDKAHRVARSRGGTWSPANILDLCRDCHTWAHAHPVDAIAVGWHVPTTADPATAPAYAWKRGGPMWILFDHDGDWTAVAAPADLSESGGTPSPLPL